MADFDRLAEEYFAEVRCSGCHQLVTPRGCRCGLDSLYSRAELEVAEWLDKVPAEVRNPARGSTRNPVGRIALDPAVRSALSRERRRAGLGDLPAQGYGSQGLSAATDARLGLEMQLGVKPRWFKPMLSQAPAQSPDPL